MGRLLLATTLLLLSSIQFSLLLASSSATSCNCTGPYPPKHGTPHPPKTKPPSHHPHPHPHPPKTKPPPHVKPPYHPPKPPSPKPPPYVPPPLPPPHVHPPLPPPIVTPPSPPTTPCPPPYVPPSPPYVPPSPPPPATCPIDALKLNACVDLLGGLIHIGIGQPAKAACCPLIQGIADLDAALCLCTTIRAKLLNLNIYLPIALELLITCGKNPPPGFQCPSPLPPLK